MQFCCFLFKLLRLLSRCLNLLLLDKLKKDFTAWLAWEPPESTLVSQVYELLIHTGDSFQLWKEQFDKLLKQFIHSHDSALFYFRVFRVLEIMLIVKPALYPCRCIGRGYGSCSSIEPSSGTILQNKCRWKYKIANCTHCLSCTQKHNTKKLSLGLTHLNFSAEIEL